MNTPFHKIDTTLNTLRERLKRRFSPSRFLRRSDGLRPLSRGGAGSEWVLGRGLLAYALFQCPPLPPRRRRAFLDTAVKRWAPFPDPRYHAEWQGPQAMVWAWSEEAVAALAQTPETAPRRVLPESLCVGGPREEGVELLALEEGFEGRVWRRGVLAASCWWPQAPGIEDWNRFLRGAGMAAAPEVPEPQRFELAATGWAGARGGEWADLAREYRPLAAAAALGVLAFAFAMPLAGVARLAWAGAQVRVEIAAQEEELQNILAARERAERDAAQVQALLALRPPAGQIELLTTVIDLLPPGARLLEWRMPNPTTLEVVIGHARPDPRALVQAWQDSGRFENVTADLGRSPEEVTVRARILRPRPEAGS